MINNGIRRYDKRRFLKYILVSLGGSTIIGLTPKDVNAKNVDVPFYITEIKNREDF